MCNRPPLLCLWRTIASIHILIILPLCVLSLSWWLPLVIDAVPKTVKLGLLVSLLGGGRPRGDGKLF